MSRIKSYSRSVCTKFRLGGVLQYSARNGWFGQRTGYVTASSYWLLCTGTLIGTYWLFYVLFSDATNVINAFNGTITNSEVRGVHRSLEVSMLKYCDNMQYYMRMYNGKLNCLGWLINCCKPFESYKVPCDTIDLTRWMINLCLWLMRLFSRTVLCDLV